MTKRVLISFAHPDDESFGLGALIAKYVAEGVDVYYICATNGDVGTVSDEYMKGYDTIADLRLAELACASEILGFKDIITFGYRDSGMVGSDTTQDPACLWYAHEHHHDAVVAKVVDVIREIRPQVVITFNKYGGYGHPDHIAIQRATEDAFALASQSDYQGSTLPPYQSQKLYYASIPAFLIRIGVWQARLRRQDPRKLGENKDIDLVKILDHVEPTHTRIHIADYLEIWDRASACHVSQGGGTSFNPFPMWVRKRLNAKQGLTRVYPKPKADRVDESDLFAGVVVDG